MRFLQQDAFTAVPMLRTKYDLVFTSPPAYPPGFNGEPLDAYVKALGSLTRALRRVLTPQGYLCLVIEEVPPNRVIAPLEPWLRATGLTLLATYCWYHKPTGTSFVVILGNSRARLNDKARAAQARDWHIPYDVVDEEYGYYEFPSALVENVLELTIPRGGTVLDPFCGKATALRLQEPLYSVTGIDVKAIRFRQPADEAGSTDNTLSPDANTLSPRGTDARST